MPTIIDRVEKRGHSRQVDLRTERSGATARLLERIYGLHAENAELARLTRPIVLGAGGMLGSHFALSGEGVFQPVPLRQADLDITSFVELERALQGCTGATLINFAAYTDVKEAEKQRDQKEGSVFRINAGGAANVANVCAMYGIRLIHISTDFVFSGTEENPGPYAEGARPCFDKSLLNWYGTTKALAESLVQMPFLDERCPDLCSIVRIAYPIRPDGYDRKSDIARDILDLYKKGELYPLFGDQVLTPTDARDLTAALWKISRDSSLHGIFHVASPIPCSPLEMGRFIVDMLEKPHGDVHEGSMQAMLTKPNAIPRPRLGGLACAHTSQKLGLECRSWQTTVSDTVFAAQRRSSLLGHT